MTKVTSQALYKKNKEIKEKKKKMNEYYLPSTLYAIYTFLPTSLVHSRLPA